MIVVRCDAGPVVGMGHLARCRALASAIRRRGCAVALFGPDPAYRTRDDEALFDAWLPDGGWRGGEADAQALLAFARTLRARGAVLDDYRVDLAYQQQLRAAGLPWLQFQAQADMPLLADLVLNYSPATPEEPYRRAADRTDARLLIGPAWAILRDEFAGQAPRAAASAVSEVLLSFGGGDDRGALGFALDALLPVAPAGLRFVVVSGRHNPANAAYLQRYAGDARVRWLIQPGDVAGLMRAADLAVLAAGTTTFEAACCGLPMLMLAIADNQIEQGRGWQQIGAGTYLGELGQVRAQELADAFVAALPAAPRQRMAEAGRAAVDGQGGDRVAAALLEVVAAVRGRP
ncbi:PseG/SpsG family protein [Rubrivivax sp. JA1026]|uniref:PseG/SpsG family protein n=1 Tax=Rubrivivax sp. JA1026 TaxID=2710888 RepID=UPI0013E97518|nr:flagellin modification protein FlmD [Rubrivivax sp. JA1026]